jgi:hypothetical protein
MDQFSPGRSASQCPNIIVGGVILALPRRGRVLGTETPDVEVRPPAVTTRRDRRTFVKLLQGSRRGMEQNRRFRVVSSITQQPTQPTYLSSHDGASRGR